MSIVIQQLGTDNANLLQTVDPDVFDHAIIPEQLQAFLEDPRHVLFVASDAEQVIGMASAFEYFHPDKQSQLFINEVGVARSHQNQGIGRKLVAALIGVAKNRGCVYAWLGTENNNVAAQACFGAVPGGSEPQPFLLYEWDLASR